MDEKIAQLTIVLKNETLLHQQLLEAAEQKRLAIIAGDVTAMEKTLVVEYDLLEKVHVAEKERLLLVNDLSAQLLIEITPITISAILEKIPAERGADLSTARQELKTVLEKLRIRTRQNAELLQASMDHVNSFLTMISNAGNVQTYNRKGTCSRAPIRLLDRQA